jgi:hypothetical protein
MGGRYGHDPLDSRHEHRESPKPKHRERIKTDAAHKAQRNVKGNDDQYDPVGTVTQYQNRGDPKSVIKQCVLDHPEMSVQAIAEIMDDAGQRASTITVSNIRTEFRHTLKFLHDRGLLRKGVYQPTQRKQDEESENES